MNAERLVKIITDASAFPWHQVDLVLNGSKVLAVLGGMHCRITSATADESVVITVTEDVSDKTLPYDRVTHIVPAADVAWARVSTGPGYRDDGGPGNFT